MGEGAMGEGMGRWGWAEGAVGVTAYLPGDDARLCVGG